MKALFTYDYGSEKMSTVRELGYEVKIVKEEEVGSCGDLKDIEVMVCYNPFNNLDMSRFEGLKWIQLSSVGIDQAPLGYLKERGITLTNNRGGYGIPMGEWVVMKSLELLKHSKVFYRNQLDKRWKIDTGVLEIYGKTIGFIGTGNIAVEAAKRFKGFGVTILGVNTSGGDVEYFDKCYPMSEIDKMISQCNIVVVTIPYTGDTHKLLNEDRFKAMKKDAYLINVSRGSIVDEAMLIEYIMNGGIKGAALDVFEEEPLSDSSPLWELENVILTPHNSWISEKRNERRFETIYENLKNYIEGRELGNIVNLEKGY